MYKKVYIFSALLKYVKKLNKASDKYIKESQKNLKKDIDKRNKEMGNKGDMGNVFHSCRHPTALRARLSRCTGEV